MIDQNSSLLIIRDWPRLEKYTKYKAMMGHRSYAIRNLERWKRQLRLVLSFIDPKNVGGLKILDVGPGVGLYVIEMAHLGYRPVGMELNPEFCHITDAVANYFGLDLRCVCGDACAIPLRQNYYDVVISKGFFEHVYNVDLSIEEQIRVLKPGGVLFFTCGNLINPKSLLNLLIKYPIRTKGKHGGVKWLFSKKRVYKNLYGSLAKGRDEDVKTMYWWRRKMRSFKDIKPMIVSTTGAYTHKNFPKFLYPFIGACLVCAKKITSE